MSGYKNNTLSGVSTTGVLALRQHYRHVSNRNSDQKHIFSVALTKGWLAVVDGFAVAVPRGDDDMVLLMSLGHQHDVDECTTDGAIRCRERLPEQHHAVVVNEGLCQLRAESLWLCLSDMQDVLLAAIELLDETRFRDERFELVEFLNDLFTLGAHEIPLRSMNGACISVKLYILYHIINKKAIVHYV